MHSRGIIHRDLKPQNILIKEDMEAMICDFSTATVLKEGETRIKGTLGTFHFMAPESLKEAKNNSAGYVGVKCDIWSLGVTF